MRALGLDLGSRRIGVALSDSAGRVATPLTTIQRTRHHETDHQAIAALVREWDVEVIAVGLPFSLDGSMGPAAQRVTEELAELARTLEVPIETVDERFTTVTAGQHLRAAGVKGRDRKRVIDQGAAAVLLQTWLDRQETKPC